MKKTPLFAIIGAILGIPLSYYFQPNIVQSKLSLSEYIGHLPEVLAEDGGDFVSPVILSIVIFTLVFGIVGYFMDQATGKTETNHQRSSDIEAGKPEK